MSMSRKKCCVPGCLDSGNSHPTMHTFPNPNKERERFSQWVLSIGGNIIGLDNEDIYKRRSVCHAHFEDKYCCRFNRLSVDAVPTLNLPGPLAVPKFTFEERRPLRFFIHNYCKDLNKILVGKRACIDDTDVLQIKAKKYFKKCVKRPLQ